MDTGKEVFTVAGHYASIPSDLQLSQSPAWSSKPCVQVEFTADKRSVRVTTKESAPGGRRTEKVGLPFDPDLFDHMVAHGVVVEVRLLASQELPLH